MTDLVPSEGPLDPSLPKGNPKWHKGMKSPNPAGRPNGIGDKRTKLARRMLEDAGGIVGRMIAQALEGDPQAAHLILSRVMPALRAQAEKVEFDGSPGVSVGARTPRKGGASRCEPPSPSPHLRRSMRTLGHVQSLVGDALDEVRRAEVRALQGEEAKTVKKTRYPLLKNPWNLTRKDQQKLADIQRNNARLYRAYLLKEAFAKALDYRQPKRAREALEEWLAWASRSQLEPFVKVARTIRKYKEGILAYIRDRYTNARVEGINNKLRVIAPRAFGFHSAEALIAMLFLNCGGIELFPRLP